MIYTSSSLPMRVLRIQYFHHLTEGGQFPCNKKKGHNRSACSCSFHLLLYKQAYQTSRCRVCLYTGPGPAGKGDLPLAKTREAGLEDAPAVIPEPSLSGSALGLWGQHPVLLSRANGHVSCVGCFGLFHDLLYSTFMKNHFRSTLDERGPLYFELIAFLTRLVTQLSLSGIFVSISWHRADIFPVTSPKEHLFSTLDTDQLQLLAQLSACVAASRTLNFDRLQSVTALLPSEVSNESLFFTRQTSQHEPPSVR